MPRQLERGVAHLPAVALYVGKMAPYDGSGSSAEQTAHEEGEEEEATQWLPQGRKIHTRQHTTTSPPTRSGTVKPRCSAERLSLLDARSATVQP